MELKKEDYLKFYRNLILTRKLEDRMTAAIAEKKIPGFMHMGRGQEAIGVGGATFLRRDDDLLHTHRGFAHAVSKGLSLETLIATIYGKKTGCSGKGEILNLIDENIGMCGVYTSIGGNFVIAVGFGLAAQMKGEKKIVAVFFGDGSSNRGTFHEAMNLASIWKLPIVWICENNQFAISTPASKSIPTPHVADRAAAYNIPGVVVDGNDVLAVHEAVGAAVDRARAGLGPSLVEAKTYRIRGHFEGDRAAYRSPEEVKEWEKKDPIARYQKYLLEKNILTSAQVTQIDQEASRKVEEAERSAAQAPDPEVRCAFEGLYA